MQISQPGQFRMEKTFTGYHQVLSIETHFFLRQVFPAITLVHVLHFLTILAIHNSIQWINIQTTYTDSSMWVFWKTESRMHAQVQEKPPRCYHYRTRNIHAFNSFTSPFFFRPVYIHNYTITTIALRCAALKTKEEKWHVYLQFQERLGWIRWAFVTVYQHARADKLARRPSANKKSQDRAEHDTIYLTVVSWASSQENSKSLYIRITCYFQSHTVCTDQRWF